MAGVSKKPPGRPPSGAKAPPPSSTRSSNPETSRSNLVIKINRYLTDELIGPILEEAGFDMRTVEANTPIEILSTKYEQIRNILGAKSAKKNVVDGFLFVNSLVSDGLAKAGYPNSLKALSEDERLLMEIQPELNEIAIEYGSYLGSSDPKWRLLMKYGNFVRQAISFEVGLKKAAQEEEEEPDD